MSYVADSAAASAIAGFAMERPVLCITRTLECSHSICIESQKLATTHKKLNLAYAISLAYA